MKQSTRLVTVRIPFDLYEAIKNKIKTNKDEFRSVDEFIVFVLKEIIKDDEPKQDRISKDEEKIKSRLRALGYI